MTTRLAVLWCALVAALWPSPAAAERLPATIYTTEQGLASNTVFNILPDSRGFIWFATREGLSRFDGYTFTNYGVDDGLPAANVNDILETREGIYLVATSAGLARLETSSTRRGGEASEARAPRFSVHPVGAGPDARHVTVLARAQSGDVWVGTRAGLFRLREAGGRMQFEPVPLGGAAGPPPVVWDVREDRFRTLWVATALGLRRLWPDGRIDAHFPQVGMHSVLEDRAGRIWAGTRLDGLLELALDPRSGQLLTTRTHSPATGFAHSWIHELLEPADGELWAASPAGLIQIAHAANGPPRVRVFTEVHGVGRSGFQSLAVDRSGNVWAGSAHGGAVKIAPSGFSAFGPSDGMHWSSSSLQSRSGDLCFVGPGRPHWGLHCFTGGAFQLVQPRFRPGAGTETWGWNQTVLEDSTGAWWFAAREGVARFAPVARPFALDGVAPARWYGAATGLFPSVVLRLFEDARHDIWISTSGEGTRNGLARWQRATDAIQQYGAAPHLPDLNRHFATAFVDDAAGNVWIGFSGTGGVARYRNGRFDPLPAGAFFRGMVRNALRDSTGRLWFATYAGLVRVDDPASESPRFSLYTTKDGLSSNEATAVVEDAAGRLYVGTGRGVDRLDPATGRIKRYSARDGYTSGEILSALADRRTGHLWFAQQSGVSRLIAPVERPPVPPPILITAVEVAAEPEPLDPLGQTTVAGVRVEPHRNHLRIDYVALGFGPGEALQYQYRLAGGGPDWSTPSPHRSVNFANLAPGSYQFQVRAVSTEGVSTLDPASVAFTVLRPVWQRWWFLALVGLAAAALLRAAHRYRLARALEIANVRTRIATDLHDDVGADLTKIAILSEVARQQLDGRGEVSERLSAIARISREAVGSMTDVVWAIDPRRDSVLDTIRRMRQHAEELVTSRGISLHFHAPDGLPRLRLSMDVRRDLFLIFKEALNNAVRHAQCRAITIDLGVAGGALSLTVTDDGRGFPTAGTAGGNGLTSMRQRAARMQAALTVRSEPGRGTTIQLSVPGAVTAGPRAPRPA